MSFALVVRDARGRYTSSAFVLGRVAIWAGGAIGAVLLQRATEKLADYATEKLADYAASRAAPQEQKTA